MKKTIGIGILALIIVMFLIAATGCNTPAAVQSGSPTVKTDSPAASPSAGDASPSAADVSASASEQATADVTSSPATPKDLASSPYFKYYVAVKLGMTKDEVDKAIGLTAEDVSKRDGVANAFNYVDGDGNGVYVLYNKSMKAYSKTVNYKDAAKALAPFTVKPVTEDESALIDDGMAHADVTKLLGGEGIECSTTASKADTIQDIGTILRWGNTDGSFIQVVFLSKGTSFNAMYFAPN